MNINWKLTGLWVLFLRNRMEAMVEARCNCCLVQFDHSQINQQNHNHQNPKLIKTSCKWEALVDTFIIFNDISNLQNNSLYLVWSPLPIIIFEYPTNHLNTSVKKLSKWRNNFLTKPKHHRNDANSKSRINGQLTQPGKKFNI